MINRKYILNLIQDRRISFFFLLVSIFLLPIWRNLFVIALWPWLFFWIVEHIYNRSRINIDFKRINLESIFLPILFLMMLTSLLWSANRDEGLNHLGRSIILVIIPVVMGFDGIIINSTMKLKLLFRSYVFGVLTALILLVLFALINSISFDNGNHIFNPQAGYWDHSFFYSRFSFLIHPTYFGMMVLLAATLTLSVIESNNINLKSNILPIILSVFFISSLFLISSRAMMIAAVFIIVWYLIYSITRKRNLYISLLVVLSILVTIIILHPRLQRIQAFAMESSGISTYKRILELSGRNEIWKSSMELIKEYPLFGVGIGDVNMELSNKFRELGFIDKSNNNWNCHNQFMELWISVGILGPLFLAFILFYPIIRIRGIQKYLYSSFMIISITGFIFESVLNRFWGVAVISLFYSILTGRGFETYLLDDK